MSAKNTVQKIRSGRLSKFNFAIGILILLVLFESGFILGQILLLNISSARKTFDLNSKDNPKSEFTIDKKPLGEQIETVKAFTEVVYDGLQIDTGKGSGFKVEANQATVDSGATLLTTKKDWQIILNNQSLTLHSGSRAIADPTQNILIVLSGTASNGEQIATTNQKLAAAKDKVSTSDFNRAGFNTSLSLKSFITLLNKFGVIVPALDDLTAPVLSGIKPANRSEISTQQTTITGKTEAGAAVTIEGVKADVAADGKFSLQVTLKTAQEDFEIVATDAAGNSSNEHLILVQKNQCNGVTNCGICGNKACAPTPTKNNTGSEV
jgi:hypothetical protein